MKTNVRMYAYPICSAALLVALACAPELTKKSKEANPQNPGAITGTTPPTPFPTLIPILPPPEDSGLIKIQCDGLNNDAELQAKPNQELAFPCKAIISENGIISQKEIGNNPNQVKVQLQTNSNNPACQGAKLNGNTLHITMPNDDSSNANLHFCSTLGFNSSLTKENNSTIQGSNFTMGFGLAPSATLSLINTKLSGTNLSCALDATLNFKSTRLENQSLSLHLPNQPPIHLDINATAASMTLDQSLLKQLLQNQTPLNYSLNSAIYQALTTNGNKKSIQKFNYNSQNTQIKLQLQNGFDPNIPFQFTNHNILKSSCAIQHDITNTNPLPQIAISDHHACAISKSEEYGTNQVHCWGGDNATKNHLGRDASQLGNHKFARPVQTENMGLNENLGYGYKALGIWTAKEKDEKLGDIYSCMLYQKQINKSNKPEENFDTSQNFVACWGGNSHLQSGIGTDLVAHAENGVFDKEKLRFDFDFSDPNKSVRIGWKTVSKNNKPAPSFEPSPSNNFPTELAWNFEKWGSPLELQLASKRACAKTKSNKLICWGDTESSAVNIKINRAENATTKCDQSSTTCVVEDFQLTRYPQNPVAENVSSFLLDENIGYYENLSSEKFSFPPNVTRLGILKQSLLPFTASNTNGSLTYSLPNYYLHKLEGGNTAKLKTISYVMPDWKNYPAVSTSWISKVLLGHSEIETKLGKLSPFDNEKGPTSNWHAFGGQYGFVFIGPDDLECYSKANLNYEFALHCKNGDRVGHNTSSSNDFETAVQIKKDDDTTESLLLEPLPFLNVRLK